jgi:nucleotide-binding universal stress UspA family protein
MYHKILVPLDGSKRAERILPHVEELASHGRGGLSRVFYGSVATGLLHRVDRPLLIIRSRKTDLSTISIYSPQRHKERKRNA